MYKLLCREVTERGLRARSVTIHSFVEALRWQHAMAAGNEVAGITHAGTMAPMITCASGNAIVGYRDGYKDYVHYNTNRPLLRLRLAEKHIQWLKTFGGTFEGLEDVEHEYV